MMGNTYPGDKDVERIYPVSMRGHACPDITGDLGSRQCEFKDLDIREKMSENVSSFGDLILPLCIIS